MLNGLQSETLLEIIKQQDIITNVDILPADSISFSQKRSDYPNDVIIQGDISIEGKAVTIFLVFDSFFPSSIPMAFLKDPHILGFMPHVEIDGFICFIEKEGTLVNSASIPALIGETLHKIQDTLSKGVRDIANDKYEDFYDEFESYWRNLEPSTRIFSLLNFDGTTRLVSESFFPKDPPTTNIKNMVFDSYEDFKRFTNKEYGKDFAATLSVNNGLYIPLGKPVLPPPYGSFWGIKDIEALIATYATTETREQIKQYYRKVLDKRSFDIFFSFERPNGGKACFGVRVKIDIPVKSKKKNSLSLLSPDTTCIPLVIKRMDKDVLLPRGGAEVNLQEKKILIIGCGSLGGYIASEVAKLGVLQITLVDPDDLNPENVYRHLAGIPYIGMKKVLAVKRILEGFMIHPKIQAVDKTVKDFLEEHVERAGLNLGIYDLIIVATGDPNVDRFINRYLHQSPQSPPTIFTWVEAYGIGGQAILTNNNGKKGCLECLYSESQNDELYNKAAFSERGQSFTQSVTGCSGLFTPFGSLDALQTAMLATRLSMEVLSGSEQDNPILSWKGSSTIFRNAGKITSRRYDFTQEELDGLRYEYKDINCSVCTKKKDE